MRAALALLLLATPASLSIGAEVARFTVTGDAIEAPLTASPASATRGEAIVKNQETANCLICHAIPDARERFMGDVGPALAGVGTRLSPGQIRLRLVDPTRLNPEAIMPAYHRTEGLRHVDARYLGRPVLSAMEIEDVVAYLAGLKE